MLRCLCPCIRKKQRNQWLINPSLDELNEDEPSYLYQPVYELDKFEIISSNLVKIYEDGELFRDMNIPKYTDFTTYIDFISWLFGADRQHDYDLYSHINDEWCEVSPNDKFEWSRLFKAEVKDSGDMYIIQTGRSSAWISF